MLRGIYTLGNGLLTQQKNMDVVTNNMANFDTVGFKRDNLISSSFKDIMIARLDNNSTVSKKIGSINRGINVDTIVTSFESGALDNTGLDTDVAINGKGFFTINTPQGIKYTKSGNFNVDIDGDLVTSEGYQVMGNNGPLNVGSDKFKVTQDGSVYNDQGYVGKMNIVEFADINQLKKLGNNLFDNTNAGNIINSDSIIVQGYQEKSNVDAANETIAMMNAYRNFETQQRIMRIMDETLAKTVNEIAKF